MSCAFEVWCTEIFAPGSEDKWSCVVETSAYVVIYIIDCNMTPVCLWCEVGHTLYSSVRLRFSLPVDARKESIELLIWKYVCYSSVYGAGLDVFRYRHDSIPMDLVHWDPNQEDSWRDAVFGKEGQTHSLNKSPQIQAALWGRKFKDNWYPAGSCRRIINP